jgi:RNA polymerase sigma-70 factor (ECF subfamily)
MNTSIRNMQNDFGNDAVHSELTDEQLLLHYRKCGDRDLFARLVHRYERELFSYLRRYLGDAAMAEDAFQATFLQVHLKCDQFDEGRRFRPWLYTIATNQAIDARRRNKRHRMISLDRTGRGDSGEDVGKLVDLLVSGEAEPLELVDQMERREQLKQLLDELPEPMQAVIQLVYYQGMKYREAAEVLDIPVGTVKSRLHAAILKLTDSWNNTHVEQ